MCPHIVFGRICSDPQVLDLALYQWAWGILLGDSAWELCDGCGC